MEFEWDEKKSDRNRQDRGLDFGTAARVFEGPVQTAIVRKTLEDIRTMKPGIDPAKLDATTDVDIARQIAADPETAPELTLDMLIAPKNLRRRVSMTQEQFAEALGIPVATLRNWEQGRHAIDPAARALLLLIARDPEGTLAALAEARRFDAA